MWAQDAELDFTGQTVYVGIDVGKKSWKVCVVVGDRQHRVFSQNPDGHVLAAYLRRMFPHARYRCVYEAGYFGFAPYAVLVDEGLECVVVNPADVPTMHKERVTKTDRIDARKLARGLQAGTLEGIHVPSLELQEDRTLVRTRESYVRKQTRVKNQIKAHLQFYGIAFPEDMDGRHWSRKFVGWLETIAATPSSASIALRAHIDELLFLRAHIAKVTRHVRALSTTERYREALRALCTLDGISMITGMVLLTELGDIRRFRGDDALACFVGLVPSEHSSGEQQHRGEMTHRGNARLRHMIIEVAWRASQEDPALLQKYLKDKARKGAQKAIVGIARKVLRRVRHVLMNSAPCPAV